MKTSLSIAFWIALVAAMSPSLIMAAPGGRVLRVPADHATIQAAVDAAADGDTVLVSPGVYTGSVKLRGKSLTLASMYLRSNNPRDVEQTVLDGNANGKRTGPLVSIARGATLRMIGFMIQNGDHAVVNAGTVEALHNHFRNNIDALSFESGAGVVRSNVFEDDRDDGVDMDDSSEGIIEDNVFRGIRDDGIEIRLHKHSGRLLNIVIRRNVFIGSREDGIQLIDYPGKSDRTIRIERNVFVGNAMAAIGCMQDGNTKENYEGADMLEPVFVINNTLIGNHYGIIGGDNMLLVNNVIADTKQTALNRVHGDSVAGPNLLWHNGTDTEECDLDTSGFVSKAPLLDEHYKPRPGSPCIDAGTAEFEHHGEKLVLPQDSYAGPAPDLGAFEFKE
ncbi:MAG TPA: right-handed parallel beta-helix repeat-containing protein [Pirellulales bacterium]